MVGFRGLIFDPEHLIGEYPANSVFIDIQSECEIDLLCDARAAKSGIAFLHLDDGVYHFL